MVVTITISESQSFSSSTQVAILICPFFLKALLFLRVWALADKSRNIVILLVVMFAVRVLLLSELCA